LLIILDRGHGKTFKGEIEINKYLDIKNIIDEVKTDTKLFSILLIPAILYFCFFIIMIITGFARCLPLSIITTFGVLIATVVSLLLGIVFVIKEDLIKEKFSKIWTYEGLRGIDVFFEDTFDCCGWKELENRCSVNTTDTCSSIFEPAITYSKYVIGFIFFFMFYIDHIALVFSIKAIVQDVQQHKIVNETKVPEDEPIVQPNAEAELNEDPENPKDESQEYDSEEEKSDNEHKLESDSESI